MAPASSDLRQGMLRLGTLYAFVEKNRANQEAPRLERTPLGREYCRLCDEIASSVQEAQGFYLWGVFDQKRYWHSLYLGKAGFGKTKSLRKRIREELKDERAFVWRAVFTKPQLHLIRDKIHNGKYKAGWDRSMLKAGSTHIAWAAAPSIPAKRIEPVEADLIEALSPRANIRRPTPPLGVQGEATEVFDKFRALIHEARNDAKVLSPSQELDLIQPLVPSASS